MQQFIDNLQSQGIYSFNKAELKKNLQSNDEAIAKHLVRYSAKKKILRIKNDFYIIIPVEYKNAGVLPPFWFIDDLMNYLKREYYVGLMSAAASHGASHQQPQVFQVIINKNLSEISLNGVKIQFVVKKNISHKYIVKKKTETGYVKISDANLSALDLIQYNKKCGGLNNAATIIKELLPKLDAEKLIDISKEENRLVQLRRLGYIIDAIADDKSLAEKIRSKSPAINFWSLLDPSLPMKGAEYNKEWGLYINRKIEMDEI